MAHKQRTLTESRFVIASEADEALLRTYIAHRDATRDTLGNGVYPNLVKAISQYAAFDAALAGELAEPGLLAYHAMLMGPIAPFVAQLRAKAEEIVAIMQGIEAASPGTFGIAVPTPETPVIELPTIGV